MQTAPDKQATTKADPEASGRSAPIKRFDQLRKGDTESAGGKGANLGELSAAGLPVPPGFVITAGVYLAALDTAGVREKMRQMAAEVDPNDAAALERVSHALQALVSEAGIPKQARAALLDAYRALGDDVRVAVRSSATMEDTAGTSFAGMNETFTNVQGEQALLDAVARCWMSLWGKRVVAIARVRACRQEPAIAVVVQQMVDSERSGVMFTADPDQRRPRRASSSRLRSVSARSSSAVRSSPTRTCSSKDGPRVAPGAHRAEDVTSSNAIPAVARSACDLSPERGRARVLADAELVELGRMGLRIEAALRLCRRTSSGPTRGGKLYCLQVAADHDAARRRRACARGQRPTPTARCWSRGWALRPAVPAAACASCRARPRATSCCAARSWSRR